MTIPYWGGKLRRKLAAKVCRFENRQWHANVRILKFILEANRNSLAKETARESSTVPGSQLSNCGTIKTYTWHNQGNGKGRHPLSRNLRILQPYRRPEIFRAEVQSEISAINEAVPLIITRCFNEFDLLRNFLRIFRHLFDRKRGKRIYRSFLSQPGISLSFNSFTLSVNLIREP